MKINIKNMMFSLPALAFVLSSGSGFGQNLITNGSFDGPSFSPPISGWSTDPMFSGYAYPRDYVNASTGQDFWAPGGYYDLTEGLTGIGASPNAYCGSNHLTLGSSGSINVGTPAIFQTITSVVAGNTYNYTGLLGNPSRSRDFANDLARADLYYQETISGVATGWQSFLTLSEQEWVDFSINYTAPSNLTGFEIGLGFSADDGGRTINLIADCLSLTQVSVPEPTSTLLLGVGSLALAARRRR